MRDIFLAFILGVVMERDHAIRTYSLFIATGIKFNKITPDCVVDLIKEYCFGDFSPPVSILPYRESVKLFENLMILSSHMSGLVSQNPELFKETSKFFDNMSEEEFVRWYKTGKEK